MLSVLPPSAIAAAASGIILLYCIRQIPTPQTILLLIVCFVLALWAVTERRFFSSWQSLARQRLQTLLLLGLCALLGLAWAAVDARSRVDAKVLPAYEQVPISVSGYLCSIPVAGAYQSVSFDWCVIQSRRLNADKNSDALPSLTPPLNQGSRIRLAWYGQPDRFAVPLRGHLQVRLKRPHGMDNPAGFAAEQKYFEQGIVATGTVREAHADATLNCYLHCEMQAFRLAALQAIDAAWGGLDQAALVESLVLGSRGKLDATHWDTLAATGTNHLLAISGMHVGLFAGFMLLLFRPFRGSRWVRWLPPWQTRLLGWLLLNGLTACYVILAGLSHPAQRAWLMIALASAASLSGRFRSPWRILISVLGIILLVDPAGVLDVGLWLSFGAVAALIWTFQRRLQMPGKLATLLLAQVTISLLLLPILGLMDKPLALAGLLANLLAIPLLGLILPLILLALPVALLWPASAPLLGQGVGFALNGLWRWLTWCASGRIDLYLSQPVMLVLGLTALLLVLPLSRRLRGVSLLIVITLLLTRAWQIPVNTPVQQAEIWVFDVGQGLAVLLRSGDKAMLYDTASRFPSGGSVAQSNLIPSLRRLGVVRLDLLVVSHADQDHAGGTADLLRQLPVAHVISGEPERLRQQLLAAGVQADVAACRGARLDWPDGHLQSWIHPQASDARYHAVLDGNDRSCALRWHHPAGDLVLLGDMSAATERLWLQAQQAPASVSILIAAHHGSRFSTSAALLAATRPDWVVFSAGYRNHFHHPHPSIVKRVADYHAVALTSAATGALRFTAGLAGWQPYGWREAAPFWLDAVVE